VVEGTVYVGVASLEEALAAFIPGYVCCSFRGSMLAVDAASGSVLWKTYMTPPGYSGVAVWASTPTVDVSTRSLYIGTGNNYSVPQAAKDCELGGGTPGQCLSPDNHVDAIRSLNMDTGAIRWATGVQGFDDWNVACIPGVGFPNNCPILPGPDFDFGSGPNLFTIKTGAGATMKVVGEGQKSGQYWALDAATGRILWSVAPAPGSTLGGIEWGTATDGKRIYISEANFFGIPYQLPDGSTTTSGSLAALDPSTGKILWQIADPTGNVNLAPVSAANGVMYASSMSGHMYALDANKGTVLWDFAGEGSSNAGPAIANGTVYWGNGYDHLGIPGFTGSRTFYAFSINGH
jgi:polyvinyl alcohol dehydrogenase (cytochrome)